ncbi:S ribonuclease [Pyrus ussuriensis x Pyrus communis]|uniref:S ribonuclease n=1 Tax=Pyrus ussuriensis x Pyrus communis TaxID=2448454 RepID=A0A5N5FM19_9ROSA|nr:S ribonuclease [Pyrus ussuriensis x Pyrus communis]
MTRNDSLQGCIFIKIEDDGNLYRHSSLQGCGWPAKEPHQDFIDEHNKARAEVGVGPIKWNETVAAYAQKYADSKIETCEMVHSQGPYGENLAEGWGSEMTSGQAVKFWVTEKPDYDYDSNSCTAGKEELVNLDQGGGGDEAFAMEDDEDDHHRRRRASHSRRIMEAMGQIAKPKRAANIDRKRERRGLLPEQKITAALQMLAYGASADQVDEIARMGKTTVLESLMWFCSAIEALYTNEYLRKPTPRDMRRLLRKGEMRGFPGMIRSIDCMQWTWKNCPSAWQGAYGDRKGAKNIILDAVASFDTWIWHAFFGVPGAQNDLNVLAQSPVFDELLQGNGPRCTYWVNGNKYEGPYYLADEQMMAVSSQLCLFSFVAEAVESMIELLRPLRRKRVPAYSQACGGATMSGAWRNLRSRLRLLDVKRITGTFDAREVGSTRRHDLGLLFWRLEENQRSSKSIKVEESRREAKLKEFQEQRAWRWSILGLRSRSRDMVGSTLSKILDKHCLKGHNFPSWYRNVKILLTLEKIVYVLDNALPYIPFALEATEDKRAKYDKHVEDDTQAKCYLLASMNEVLQRQHKGMDSASSIILHFTELYGEWMRNRHFSTFVMNYNMSKMDNTLSELLNMLVTPEKTMKKENVVGTSAVAYNKPSSSKAKPKGKGKGKEKKSSTPKAQGGVKKKKEKEPKETYHHCAKDMHWKKNCRLYLTSLKDKPQGEGAK